jgi:aspartate racemase
MRPVRAHRVVGIIGGMGPEATLDLMRRVITKTPAQDDQDHIHLLIESNPKIPSRIAHLIDESGPDPTPELIRIAENLEKAGADALAMPCNTAHAYATAIRSAVGIPFIDMIAITVAEVAQGMPSRVGLLASSAVLKTRLYEAAFAAQGIKTVAPADQTSVMKLIKAVKQGATGPVERAALEALAKELANEVDSLIVACSELSVISDRISVPFTDSVEVLANHIVRFAGIDVPVSQAPLPTTPFR